MRRALSAALCCVFVGCAHAEAPSPLDEPEPDTYLECRPEGRDGVEFRCWEMEQR